MMQYVPVTLLICCISEQGNHLGQKFGRIFFKNRQ